MEAFSNTIFLMALGVWLGGVVFFSFFTAPVIFERLPRNQAADLISVIFPRYYNLGYLCGLTMLIAGLVPLIRDLKLGLVWTIWILALVATSVSLYAGKVVMPRVRKLRHSAASSAGTHDNVAIREAYNRAHQLSVTLNSMVLLVLVAEILLFGYRVRFDILAS
ncbi:MAG: DUF4149 domain-containing protein [Planctomycetota bacterium]